MKNINWNNVKDVDDRKRLIAGGYIARITSATDEPAKEYTFIEYDIAEGEFKDYYKELYEAKNFWGGQTVKSYKEKALPFYKAFLTAIKESNAGFMFNNDERNLVGKVVGIVLGEEEYRKKDGGIGKRLYVNRFTSTDKIRTNDFDIPELKKLNPVTNTDMSFYPVDNAAEDEDLPF